MRKSKRQHNKAENASTPDVLYKYLHENRKEILYNQRIRFTQPQYLNDPFEVKPIFRNIYNDNDTENAISNAMLEGINNIIQNNPVIRNDHSARNIAMLMMEDKVSLIKNDFMKLIASTGPKIEEIFYKSTQKKITILSLTEARNNLLMWSHYANQHRGFVIGFKGDHGFINHRLTEKDELRHPRRVKYTAKRPEINSDVFGGNSDKLFEMFFLTKSIDWGYEKEWRVLDGVDNADEIITKDIEEICLYNAPHAAISEIVIGARASDNFKRWIASYMKISDTLHHARLYRAVTSFDNFGLDFLEVRYKSSVENIVHDLFAEHKDNSFNNAMKEYVEAFENKTGLPFITSQP